MFDYLSLVNVEAWKAVGQWDVFIPYYATDCDAYERARMMGYSTDEVEAGYIFDIADTVAEPEAKFFQGSFLAAGSENHTIPHVEVRTELNSTRFNVLKEELRALEKQKKNNGSGRNTWQNRQKGGKGENWTYDPKGFQVAWWDMAQAGRQIYASKWGTSSCDLRKENKKIADMWRNAREVVG